MALSTHSTDKELRHPRIYVMSKTTSTFTGCTSACSSSSMVSPARIQYRALGKTSKSNTGVGPVTSLQRGGLPLPGLQQCLNNFNNTHCELRSARYRHINPRKRPARLALTLRTCKAWCCVQRHHSGSRVHLRNPQAESARG